MTTATAPDVSYAEQFAPRPPRAVDSVHIRGFRSLADVRLTDLPNAMVLIGANGAGKSNIIRFFEMVSGMLRDQRLGDFVERNGGADDQLFGGRRTTSRIEAEISRRVDGGRADYRFALACGQDERFYFAGEAFRFRDTADDVKAEWQDLGSGHREARLPEIAQGGEYPGREYPGVNPQTARAVLRPLRSCAVYQFHDTSHFSNLKKSWDVTDTARLRSDAGNLAAILYRMEQEDYRRYRYICLQIARIVPGFDRFDLAERYGKVMLRWRPQWGDQSIGAHLTSDGTLRFFALATLLSLPAAQLDDLILLDEPELGLHPTSALDLLGGMIASQSVKRQVIAATQSPVLLNTFELDEIFTLELEKGKTRINRIDPKQYQRLLDEDFTARELWQEGYFQHGFFGGPR